MTTFTLDDLRGVEQAIATGELTIERGGDRVTYRSMDDLIRARNVMREEMSAAGLLPGSGGRHVTTFAQFDRD
ncbi:hypothetical protein NH8B_0978 [Pseudogulbenkiania sp. NH8B]|uniref:phage head-tail joining protein n=1 Tax=Pseudogulbenkiania sp. (strain NH8B) TaxID=748280 RepID=UPI0002279A90|nr:hypothetical protein [Pseudogulbenkiania sp. NH8B]BAK75810.1 hypothetical protein NH8B_0978 [Pseudogulbenkiania sp. NH8B]